MFGISFFAGIAATLTPLVFQALLFYFFIFAKLSKSTKEHWINIILFSVINIVSLIFLTQFIFSNDMNEALEHLSYIIIALEVLTIIFAIWLTGFLIKMVEENGVHLTNQIFRFLGVFVLSLKLAFVSFSSAGPIIGALLVAENNTNLTMSLIGFSSGVIIPFILIIGLLGGYKNKKNRDKKWIKVTHTIIGVLLIITAIYKISTI
mgnify:CR=1 FL=1